MYSVRITASAQRDLNGIYDYIASELANRTAAAALLDEVGECYDALRRYPNMYELCRNIHLSTRGYRKAVIRNYVMLYRVDQEKETVWFMRFFYGAQDYEKLI